MATSTLSPTPAEAIHRLNSSPGYPQTTCENRKAGSRRVAGGLISSKLNFQKRKSANLGMSPSRKSGDQQKSSTIHVLVRVYACTYVDISYLVVFPWREIVGGLQVQAQVVVRHLKKRNAKFGKQEKNTMQHAVAIDTRTTFVRTWGE